MKLTRLHFSAATFAAFTMLSLFGCGGGGTPSSGSSVVSAGSKYWYESSRTEDGVAKGCYKTPGDDPNSGKDGANPCQGFNFNADGTTQLWNYSNIEDRGTYRVEGKKIFVTLSDGVSTEVGDYTVSGDTMTISGTDDAGKRIAITFKLVNIPV